MNGVNWKNEDQQMLTMIAEQDKENAIRQEA